MTTAKTPTFAPSPTPGSSLTTRGQGLAAELVEFALREAQEAELEVLPYCSYVRDHIAGHPEYLELVPAGSRGSFGLEAATPSREP
ncbi:MAG TPA: N-acetyltransferase [Solirubrobacterales bacterium]|nr:N-acetyltransferase [Solirubrobacterales bacterium]